MGEPQFQSYPNLSLAQHVFTITNPNASSADQSTSVSALQKAIKDKHMAPLYRYLAHPTSGILNPSGEGSVKHPERLRRGSSTAASMLASKRPVLNEAMHVELPWDEALYEELKKENEKELEQIQQEEQDAIEKAGETEIGAARAKRAEFWAKVGDKEQAISSLETILENTSILGTKIDILFALIRIGFFFADRLLVRRYVERCNTLVESGGDWDRRNRLKAYHGLHLLTARQHAAAAPLLLDSLSTFTSYELCSYSSLIVYAIVAGSVSLKRVDFKAKVVDAPEIRAVVGSAEDRLSALTGTVSSGLDEDDADMPDVEAPDAGGAKATPSRAAVNLTTLGQGHGSLAELEDAQQHIDFAPLGDLIQSLYAGHYRKFFGALARVEQHFLSQDRYLAEHKAWFVREMRLRAYGQLLQSYRVVGLNSMAQDFGVSVDFLDNDLKNFIAADRVSCRVDRVNGVIETNRPDDKNKQYNDVVKQGDQLITKLQKYGQTVRMRGSERA